MTKPAFEIECQWLPPTQGDTLEHGTQAALSIYVKGKCVTRFEDRFTSRIERSPGLSAHRLAQWIASNWWRLRWEPDRSPNIDWQMSHNMAAIGGGYLWPCLRFSSDGETILVQSKAAPDENKEPIRYTEDYVCPIAASGFEQGVDDFIDTTISRMSVTASEETDLKELWWEISKEREDEDLYQLRKLEACLGYDPAEAPDKLIAELQEARARYGAGAVHELVAASQDKAGARLRALKENTLKSDHIAEVHRYDAIRFQYKNEEDESAPPWRRANVAAKIARQVWTLPSGPITTSTMSELFGVRLTSIQDASASPASELRGLSVGLRDSTTSNGFRFSLHQPRETGRRFTLARLIGDYFMAPEEPMLPATPAKTSRQKFQRAFAQEFLCPSEDLKSFLSDENPGEEDIEYAAAHFEVSPLTVTRTLQHIGVLPPETYYEWTG